MQQQAVLPESRVLNEVCAVHSDGFVIVLTQKTATVDVTAVDKTCKLTRSHASYAHMSPNDSQWMTSAA